MMVDGPWVKGRTVARRMGMRSRLGVTLWLAAAVTVLLVALPSVASGKRRVGSTTEPASR
jgi:hypothetical protein